MLYMTAELQPTINQHSFITSKLWSPYRDMIKEKIWDGWKQIQCFCVLSQKSLHSLAKNSKGEHKYFASERNVSRVMQIFCERMQSLLWECNSTDPFCSLPTHFFPPTIMSLWGLQTNPMHFMLIDVVLTQNLPCILVTTACICFVKIPQTLPVFFFFYV